MADGPTDVAAEALNRIERVAEGLSFFQGPFRTAADLRAALERELVELQGAYTAAGGVLAGDPEAGVSLRGYLGHAPEFGYPDSFRADGSRPTKTSRLRSILGLNTAKSQDTLLSASDRAARPFVTASLFVDLCFASALIATNEEDWDALGEQLSSLFERAEWIESFYAAALASEANGDPAEFTALSRLYAAEWTSGHTVESEAQPADANGFQANELRNSGDYQAVRSSARRGQPPRRAGAGGAGRPNRRPPSRPPRGERPARKPAHRTGTKRPPRNGRSAERRGCVVRMRRLAQQFRAWAEANRPSAPIVFAESINSVMPNRACAGAEIRIQGTGFGATQLANVMLMLPSDDGCQPVVVPAAQWSDTEIRVVLPGWARAGCIGFYDTDAEAEHRRYREGLYEQQRRLRSSLAVCGVRQRPGREPPWRSPCPPCTGNNTFLGTIPEIQRFVGNDQTTLVIEPDATVMLAFEVGNADSIRVLHLSGGGPALDETYGGGMLIVDLITLTYAVGQDTDDVYRLTATNSCATVTADVFVHVRLGTSVSIRGIEVIQAIQNFVVDDASSSNDVFLVEGKRTMVRVYVDSGMPSSYNTGGLLPASATLESEPLSGQGFGNSTSLGIIGSTAVTAQPIDSVDRLTLTDTFNFEPSVSRMTGRIRFRARLSSTDPFAAWTPVESTVTVDFLAGPGDLDLVVLRVNDQFRAGLTTQAEVAVALKDVRAMYPIPADGIALWSTGGDDILTTNRDYNDDDSWDELFDDIEETAEEFEDNGEIWCGAVTAGAKTNSGTAGLGKRGDWWWYSKACWLSGLTATPAHEIGHAIGHDHSTSRTGIVGMHVQDRVVKDTSRPDMMAQIKTFGDPDRWPSLTRYILLDWSMNGVLERPFDEIASPAGFGFF